MRKVILKWLCMALSFILIGFGLLYLLVQPYIRPMTSIYGMISQNQTPDFSETAKKLYTDDQGLPTSGTVAASSIASLSIGDTYGNVEIPSASIDVPLIYGSNDECLYKGAGQRLQSKKPGYGQPVMIAGHRIPYFQNFGQVKKGDKVIVKTFYGIFTYRITGSKIVNQYDMSSFDLTQNKEQLILFTCYPFDTVGEASERYFLYADKVSGPSVKEEQK